MIKTYRKMNKKLIKQLKSVGFTNRKELGDVFFELDLKGYSFRYCTFNDNLWLDANLDKCNHYNLSFEAILKTIEDITGEVLAVELTKSQRIEALEAKTKRLEKDYDSLFDLCDKIQKRNRTIDHAIEGLKLAALGLGERMNKELDSLKDIETPQEQPEEPAFKVGDEVVLVCDTNGEMDQKLVDAIVNREILKVDHFDTEIAKWCVPIGGSPYYFETKDLQHAPKKKLQFGGWAEVVNPTDGRGFKVGQKVLIGALDSDGDYCCSTVDDWHYLKKEDLKPL